jgi:hypothetical protein
MNEIMQPFSLFQTFLGDFRLTLKVLHQPKMILALVDYLLLAGKLE